MEDVEIKYDKAKLKRIQRTLSGIPGAMGKVMSRAVNKTVMSARTQIVRRMAAISKIKQKDIRKKVYLEKATRKKWVANIRISGGPLPLMAFSPRQTKAGVSYFDPEKGTRELKESAFIATMPDRGHKGVFKRRAETRLHIDEKYGPSLRQIFENAKSFIATIQREAAKDLNKNIQTQIGVLLGQMKKAG